MAQFPLVAILILGNIWPTLSKDLYVGGLFDASDSKSESAFRLALNRINLDNQNTKLVPISEKIPTDDSYLASEKVCQMVQNNGLVAILSSSSTSSHIQSICDVLGIPHLTTHSEGSTNAINIYPFHLTLEKAYGDVIRALDWKSITILYEEDDELIPFQDFLALANSPGYQINVRKLIQSHGDYRFVLKKVEEGGIRNIILACSSSETVSDILKQAQQVGLITSSYSFFITSLDLHMVDLEDYRYSGVDMIGLSLLHSTGIETDRLNTVAGIEPWSYGINSTHPRVTTETALTYDAVRVIAKGLQQFNDLRVKPLNCDVNESWINGKTLHNRMKTVELEGQTGFIEFESNGFRTQFNLNILKLLPDGLNVVTSWNPITGINDTLSLEDETPLDDDLSNKTLIITSILNKPYFMLKDSKYELTGNDRFEGFVVDIIDEMSKMLGFDYRFKLVEDSKYGTLDPTTGEWNGIIRELLDEKADLGIADLTITSQRQSAVEFSHPFMDTGITILYKAPAAGAGLSLFHFLAPFSPEVWIYLLIALVGIIISIFILAKLSPVDPDDQREPKELENSWTFSNSIWFSISSLMQQGCDLNFKTISTRLMAGTWWIFTLILVLSYIANLAALLTDGKSIETQVDPPISSILDLADHPDIKFGLVKHGSTYSFFRDSPVPYHKKMWRIMEEENSKESPGPYTQSAMEGVQRVQDSNGRFAFLTESQTIEYFIGKECDLMQIGTQIDLKSYGIAMKPGMQFKAEINQAILKLKETNQLQKLKNKWWNSRKEACGDKVDISQIRFANVAGVFIVLMAGIVIAILISFCEFFWEAQKTVKSGANSWNGVLRQLGSDLLTIKNTKPVLAKPNLPVQDNESML